MSLPSWQVLILKRFDRAKRWMNMHWFKCQLWTVSFSHSFSLLQSQMFYFLRSKWKTKKKKNWILCEIQVLSAKNYDVGAPTVRSYGQMAKLFCFPTEYPQACRIMSVISWSFTVLYSPGHGCKTHKQPSCLITMLESWF